MKIVCKALPVRKNRDDTLSLIFTAHDADVPEKDGSYVEATITPESCLSQVKEQLIGSCKHWEKELLAGTLPHNSDAALFYEQLTYFVEGHDFEKAMEGIQWKLNA